MNTIGITIARPIASAITTAAIPSTRITIAIETIGTALTCEKINPTTFYCAQINLKKIEVL